ncbi:uncharacterized protein BO97DRAFT_464108 [Aspergillus homomorphus CBS 101889]|uniref:BTB domain-containing protein n=1 Tax=Aspergillus homomorphus (strain CBS 101889) TaxID=1450537 RepID=A0A395I4W6_ASPHC|nr:hypothetical protein BO97DRAFT_464108 [Aspergillus homomorphus CBS 101889]RAL14779.1 hypothetical protein BO97DRAFT_464108 [Aspergillus homomorphus CBS 101889]
MNEEINHKIDPEGEILIILPGDIKFQVSKKSLGLASPVFKEMLDAAPADNGRIKLDLEWKEKPFLILMQAMHCQMLKIPAKTSFQMILDLMAWLFVSWVWDDKEKFEACARVAIEESVDSVKPYGLPLSEEIIENLNTRRKNAIEGIMNKLWRKEDQFLSAREEGQWGDNATLLGWLRKNVHTNITNYDWAPGHPYRGLSYRKLLNDIASFKNPRPELTSQVQYNFLDMLQVNQNARGLKLKGSTHGSYRPEQV